MRRGPRISCARCDLAAITIFGKRWDLQLGKYKAVGI